MTAKVNPAGAQKITRLLVAGDPEPVNVANGGARGPCVIVCDHAGRATPQALGRLGLPEAAFERHIAWDIGAGAVSLLLGEALDAPVVRQAYSRLVIDCNRAPGRSDAIVEISDGIAVPGNRGLSPADVEARIAEVHAPYHQRIAEVLDRQAAAGAGGVILSVHSFTPRMNGHDRPWRFGVLHESDSPLSDAMLAALREDETAPVGDNEPYAMDGIDYTVPLHARTRGMDYLEIEIRQDLIADPAGQAEIAQSLARAFSRALARLGAG